MTEVVDRYSRGGVPNPFLDRQIRSLNLSDQEKKDLVAFLESLTGNIRYHNAGDEPNRAAVSIR